MTAVGLSLGDVGNLLVKKDPAFDTRNFGFKKLSDDSAVSVPSVAV